MQNDVATNARHMVRRGLKGALATLDAETGAPYASMVILATDAGGAPLTLISGLARHTRNLQAATAASILIDTSNAAGNAESGGRISLMGKLVSTSDTSVRTRFLSRHPSASAYADFADFSFYRFEINAAHFIESFGRIAPLPASALMPPAANSLAFSKAEPTFVSDLQCRWPMVTGFDCEGVDLLVNEQSDRIPFPTVAATPEQAHAAAANCLAIHRFTL